MFKSHTIRNGIVLVLIALIGIGLWYFILTKIHAEVAAAAAAENAADNKINVQEEDQTLSAFLTSNNDEISGLSTVVVSSGGTAQFIEMIEDTARTAGLGIVINSVDADSTGLPPSASANTYEELKLSMKVDGSWSDVYKFLSLLEVMPYQLKITSLDLSNGLYTDTNGNSLNGASNLLSASSTWSSNISFQVLKLK